MTQDDFTPEGGPEHDPGQKTPRGKGRSLAVLIAELSERLRGFTKRGSKKGAAPDALPSPEDAERARADDTAEISAFTEDGFADQDNPLDGSDPVQDAPVSPRAKAAGGKGAAGDKIKEAVAAVTAKLRARTTGKGASRSEVSSEGNSKIDMAAVMDRSRATANKVLAKLRSGSKAAAGEASGETSDGAAPSSLMGRLKGIGSSLAAMGKKDKSASGDDDAAAPKKSFSLNGLFKKKPKAEGDASAPAKSSILSFLKKKKDDDSAPEVVVLKEPLEVDYDGQKVIRIGKKKAAIGLFWQTKTDDQKIKTIVSDLSEVADYSLYVPVAKGRQIGLADREEGYNAKHLAGVTLFSERLQARNWIGVFQIDDTGDKYWLVAFREGMVFQDIFLDSYTAAREAFDIDMRAPGWEVIYAPDAWGVSGTSDLKLGQIADIKHAKTFKHVSPIRANLGRIVFGSFLLLTIAGGGSYYSYTMEQQRLAEEELARFRQEQLRAAQAEIPWRTYMSGEQFFAECQDAIEDFTVFAPGWTQTSFSCAFDRDHLVLTTGWNRNSGRIAYLRSLMPPEAPPIAMDPSGNRVDISVRIPIEVQDLTSQFRPWAPEQLTRVLAERFQTMGLPVNITQVVARPQARSASQGARNANAPVFNYHNITFATSVAVTEYLQLLSDVPAVLPETLDYDMTTNRWSFVARAYHPPIGL